MSEKIPNDLENNDKEPLSSEECEESRNEKLDGFYKDLEDTVKQHKAEFRADAWNVLGGIGGIFEKMGK